MRLSGYLLLWTICIRAHSRNKGGLSSRSFNEGLFLCCFQFVDNNVNDFFFQKYILASYVLLLVYD